MRNISFRIEAEIKDQIPLNRRISTDILQQNPWSGSVIRENLRGGSISRALG